MESPSAPVDSRVLPPAYREWQLRARRLLEPLVPLVQAGKASLPIEGKASDHDLNADRLESFARPFLLFAHWKGSLYHRRDTEDEVLEGKLEAWFRQALLLGTDPDGEAFWGWSSNFHQHSVEMGLLVIGLELSRTWMWESLTEIDRQQVLSWLESDAGNGHHWNNHMFFGIFVLEFLLREGRGFPSYRVVIDRWFGDLESMYLGEGWFMDGMNQSVDFYNAYAWHYYSLWWIKLYGDQDPERVARWQAWTQQFLEHYPLFFSAHGEQPAFGRSITYRFNASAPFGMAQWLKCSPVPAGLARTLCERNLDFFLKKPIYQGQGCLSMGWYDVFEDMVESYSCGGSPYWAAKAFAPLLLSPEDPFWTEPSKPLPSEGGDVPVAFPSPGLIVRSCGGEVEIINAGSQIASCNVRFGTWKWGKLSYRSSIGFLITRDPDQYPLDAGLSATNSNGSLVLGRHYTAPVSVTEDHMACLYSLGHKSEQSHISVETHMWWKGGWQLIVHRFISHQPSLLRHGSYALSASDAAVFKSEQKGEAYASVWGDGSGIALQSLHGFSSISSDDRLDDESGPRVHIQAPYHMLRCLERPVGVESDYLACLSWAGNRESESEAWQVVSLNQGCWELNHPELGSWLIEDESLPLLK